MLGRVFQEGMARYLALPKPKPPAAEKPTSKKQSGALPGNTGWM
jgi:hypothetical protein